MSETPLRDTPLSDIRGNAALAGRRVMVPETRELEVLAKMLERHGAAVLRCPLVAIVDAADPAPVEAWLRRFIATPPDDLILLTGRACPACSASPRGPGSRPNSAPPLAGTRRIVRGPKPQARLRSIGLAADISAGEPDHGGRHRHPLGAGPDRPSRRVQLYPDNPNDALLDFLRGAGAVPDAILPYAYATREDDARVLAMLEALEAGRLDLAVFTSTPQVKRLAQSWPAPTGCGRRSAAPASPRSGRWSARRWRPPAAGFPSCRRTAST